MLFALREIDKVAFGRRKGPLLIIIVWLESTGALFARGKAKKDYLHGYDQ